MKTIGVVGGIAWPSSLVYYRTINELIAKRMNGNALHSAKLILVQTDFEEIERWQTAGRWDKVGEILAAQGNKLKAAGADFFLLACNTVHAAAPFIEPNVDLPMIHIVDAAARKIKETGAKVVGLLGSRYTMTGDYFVGPLTRQYNLKVLVAEGEHQDNVHNALYSELARGIFLSETRSKFKAAIAHLVSCGAEVIILGCTEFGMLVQAEDSSVPIIDTSITHAEAAVEMALSD